MTREVATVLEADEPESPESDKTEPAADPERPRRKDKGGDKGERPERETPELARIRREEDKSLAEWLSTLGNEGAYRVALSRDRPQTFRDPKTNKEVKTNGHLQTYAHQIDEDFIRNMYGGGTYSIKVTRRRADGSYGYEKGLHRTIEIGGDPLLDNLPTNQPPPGAAGSAPVVVSPPSEMPVAREIVGLLKDQLSHRDRAPTIDPAVQMMFEQMNRAAATRDAELAELRRTLAGISQQKPQEDPIKEKLFESMLTGQSGHVEALRLRLEAEIRQIKELAAADLQRVRDAAEAEIRRNNDRAERELATVKDAHAREIAAIRASHEVMLASTSTSSGLQVQLLKSDAARLERENTQLREDLRELRQKKEQSLSEKIEEISKVKDILGDESGDKSNLDKLIEIATSPAGVEFVKGVVGKGDAAPQQAAAGTGAVQSQKPQLVQGPDGNTYWLRGGKLLPAKKKQKVIPAQTNADGTVVTPEMVLPQVDEDTVKNIVGLLERAFEGGQDPHIVAQSSRSMVPEEILGWIREHHSDQTSGVDLFMSKVARLPGTSPLTTQAGRNWLRKLGKALVGE